MSKKNRKKHRIEGIKTPIENKPKMVEEPQKEEMSELKRDFIGLAKSIGFILLLLAAIYYFDQKDNILENFTNNIFNAI